MNQTKMNIESAYSITSALVSEAIQYFISSRLDIIINNKQEFYLRNVISKAKKEKLSLKTAYNKIQLKVD